MVAGLNGAGLRVVMDVVYNHTVGRRHRPEVGARPDRARLLPPAARRRHGRQLDLLRQHRARARHDGQAGRRLGRRLGQAVQGGRFPVRPDGPPPEGEHARRAGRAGRADPRRATASTASRSCSTARAGTSARWPTTPGSCRRPRRTWPAPGIGTFNDRLRDAVRGGGPFDGNPRMQGFALRACSPTRTATRSTARPTEQRARLLHYHDLIKVGLTGNLAGYRFIASDGRDGDRRAGRLQRLAGRLHRRARRGGHLRRRARQRDPVRRAGVQAAGRHVGRRPGPDAGAGAVDHACSARASGSSRPGSDRLRSKSLDRNSYNSGDWFNQIRWDCASGNGFGARPAAGAPTTRDKWPYARPLLADPALVPGLRGDRPGRRAVRRAAADPARRRRCSACRTRGRGAAAAGVPAVRPGRDAGRDHDDAGRARPRPAVERRWWCSTRPRPRRPRPCRRCAARGLALHPVLRALGRPGGAPGRASTGTGTFTVPAADGGGLRPDPDPCCSRRGSLKSILLIPPSRCPLAYDASGCDDGSTDRGATPGSPGRGAPRAARRGRPRGERGRLGRGGRAGSRCTRCAG